MPSEDNESKCACSLGVVEFDFPVKVILELLTSFCNNIRLLYNTIESVSYTHLALRLLKLDERVRRMVVEDKIKSGHARALLSIKDGELQYETALQIFDGNLTVRETEKLVKKLLEEPKPSKKEDVEINKQLQIIYEQYEEKLKNKLGTKVKINQKNNGKGKIEIEYYSADDFDRIIEAITQK